MNDNHSSARQPVNLGLTFFRGALAGWLLICAGAISVLGETAAAFYVSPTGSDANDGRTPLRAFATVAKARDAVRAVNSQMHGDIIVEIARGDYPLKETLIFTERDSGSNGFDVIYRNHDAIGSARFVRFIGPGGKTLVAEVEYYGHPAPGRPPFLLPMFAVAP